MNMDVATLFILYGTGHKYKYIADESHPNSRSYDEAAYTLENMLIS